MKKTVLLTLAAAAVLGLTACNPSTASSQKTSETTTSSQPAVVAAVTNLAVSAAADTIMVGGTTQLTATVTAGAGVETGVIYASSDVTVATVSDAGLVTGLKAGTVTITVTTKGKDANGAAVVKTIDISISADYIKFINAEGEHTIKAVVAGISGKNMLLRDATGLALIYDSKKNWSADTLVDGGAPAVGDYLKVTETFTKSNNYAYGSYNFTSKATIAKLDKTKAPTFTDTAVAYDAAKLTAWTTDHKTAETSRGWTDGTSAVVEKDHIDDPYVSVNVKLFKSGTYLNYSVNDFTGSLSSYIADGITDLKADNDQKTYTIKGFLTGVTSGKYTYLFVTSAEAYTRAATDVDAGIKTFTTDADAAGIKVGSNANLTVTMNDCPNLADKTITFTSSDAKIASVAVADDSLHATVTAVAAGTVTITAKSVSGDTKTVDVKVIADDSAYTWSSAAADKDAFFASSAWQTSVALNKVTWAVAYTAPTDTSIFSDGVIPTSCFFSAGQGVSFSQTKKGFIKVSLSTAIANVGGTVKSVTIEVWGNSGSKGSVAMTIGGTAATMDAGTWSTTTAGLVAMTGTVATAATTGDIVIDVTSAAKGYSINKIVVKAA
jgi:uncharacterized protein YjdB